MGPCSPRLARVSASMVMSMSRPGFQRLWQGLPRSFARLPQSHHASTLGKTQQAHESVFEDVSKPFKPVVEYGILRSLQARYPDFSVTLADDSAGLLAFAHAGEAEATLDMEGQNLLAWLKYEPPKADEKSKGEFQDLVYFGRYDYHWNHKSFVVYSYCRDCRDIDTELQIYFILYPREHDQILEGRSTTTRELIKAASSHTNEVHEGDVLVFDDDYWRKSTELWRSVQRSKWENVILDEKLKEMLIRDVEGFFNQENDYKQFEVPWKRGIILHGLPGNGKTMTVKALMNGLAARDKPIPTLYVKSTEGNRGTVSAIRSIFKEARRKSPCLLVFEDLESMVTDRSRSFFLNEVDGMESNDGIMMIGSTNYLERLDAGITKRPSRFDRKYHFDLPALSERSEYCEYWRQKLLSNKTINFPTKLCSAIAGITDGFSFAYLQEAFISSLLVIVGKQRDNPLGITESIHSGDDPSLDSYILWRVMCEQVEMLRNEIRGSRKSAKDAMEYIGPIQASKAGFS